MSQQPVYALAMDIGGSHVTAAVVDVVRREILPDSRTRLPVYPSAEADVILGAWARAAAKAAGSLRVARIGMAIPGPFDYPAGISRMEHKFQALNGLNVFSLLRARWQDTQLADLPIQSRNDADLFALGEWWAGAARGHERMIGLTIGTGLGSGFIARGEIQQSGPQVPPDGDIWNLPYLDGIAEDYVSARAVTTAFRRGSGYGLSAVEVARAAERQDPRAIVAYAQIGRHLVGILDPLVRAFAPTSIVIGGNIARSWPLFGAQVEMAWPGVQVRASSLFEDATLFGAAALSTV